MEVYFSQGDPCHSYTLFSLVSRHYVDGYQLVTLKMIKRLEFHSTNLSNVHTGSQEQ